MWGFSCLCVGEVFLEKYGVCRRWADYGGIEVKVVRIMGHRGQNYKLNSRTAGSGAGIRGASKYPKTGPSYSLGPLGLGFRVHLPMKH